MNNNNNIRRSVEERIAYYEIVLNYLRTNIKFVEERLEALRKEKTGTKEK